MKTSEMGFNYRSGHPVEFESLWSATHKFMVLNAVSSVSFLRYFKDDRGTKEFLPVWIKKGRCTYPHDLRFSGQINSNALAKVCRAGSAWLETATIDCYTTVFDRRQCSAPFLRFCPFCIDRGFHAVVFQLLDWRKCPIHDEPLRDSCPKCGDWIPMGLPKTQSMPYCCAKCRYQLWLDSGSEEWPSAFISDDEAAIFRTHASERLIKQAGGGVAEGPRSAVFWMSLHNRFSATGDRIQDCADMVFDESKPPAQRFAVIRREWGSEFASRRWPKRMMDSYYSALPVKDEEIRRDIYAIYRSIERHLFKRFGVTFRRKSLTTALKTIGFQRLPEANLSPDFLGYLVWRAYWEERPSTLCMRRVFGKKFWGSHYQRKMERSVYWRYTQHAKILGPAENFTSADAWSHLHFFALAAFATYRRSVEFVATTERLENVIKAHHATHVVQARPPLTLLVRIPLKRNTFELKIYADESKRTSGLVEEF